MTFSITRGAQALLPACLLLAAGLSAAPASAQAVGAAFNGPTATGASGSGVGGTGYTPFFFDINFNNTSGDSYDVTSETFNSSDPTTISDLTTGDVITSYNGTTTFTLPTGTTTQPQVFELDVDGTVPANTVLTGDLDFEGTDTTTGQQLTVADPVFRFTVPPASSPPAVPEPSALALFALATLSLGGLSLRARLRKRLTWSVPSGYTFPAIGHDGEE